VVACALWNNTISLNIALMDSHSQRDFLIQHGVVSEVGSKVLGDGSISGVNLDRLYPDVERRDQVRSELGIADTANVILYLGRLKRDKGVHDLAQAFLEIHAQVPETVLLVIGPDEDSLLPILRDRFDESGDCFVYVPYTRTPEHFMRAADILYLPSYREGFGSVVIEAAACKIPSVVTRIYGLTVAVVDNDTGLFVTAGDVSALAKAVIKLATNDVLRAEMGVAARKRAEKLFNEKLITQELLLLYARNLSGLDAE
jgi:glycosyltransferase involved in cell wall biosynthesis